MNDSKVPKAEVSPLFLDDGYVPTADLQFMKVEARFGLERHSALMTSDLLL
jgi:hypothetical protein